MTFSVGDTVLKAVEEFDEHGWTTGTNVDFKGRMCAVGAVCKALCGSPMGMGLYKTPGKLDQFREVAEALAAHVPEDFKVRSTRTRTGYEWRAEQHVVEYNNSRNSYDEIREWFMKTALDEGVSLG